MLRAIIASGLLILSAACGASSIESVPCPRPPRSLVPSADTMYVGDVAQFQIPVAQLSERSTRQIRWTMDNNQPARVDSLTGVVIAVGAGITSISATDRLTAASCPDYWVATVLVR